MTDQKKSRPTGQQDGIFTNKISNPSLAPEAVEGWAALTQVRTTRPTAQPVFRRKVYFSLAAAQKAVTRARDRGLDAEVVLVELRPIGGGR